MLHERIDFNYLFLIMNSQNQNHRENKNIYYIPWNSTKTLINKFLQRLYFETGNGEDVLKLEAGLNILLFI